MGQAQDHIRKAKRIVLKIGSALVTDTEKGIVLSDWLKTLSQDIATYFSDKEIVIVSSGAIALGRTSLNIDLKKSPKELKIEEKQAAASIGQIKLIETYANVFKEQDLKIAQVLLTPRDTENRRTHLNARSTLTTLLEHKIIPIVNENDSTATDEIRFGDNDRMAARVAQMVEADTLLILSTTDGLYTDNPQTNPEATHLSHIENITDDLLQIAKEATSGISTGGMKSKLQSTKMAVDSGTTVIITKGTDKHALKQFMEDLQLSTLFQSQGTPHNARKRWIKAHLKLHGTIKVDRGAEKALNQGRSLLPVGVVEITGEFKRGDAVSIHNENNEEIGIGLSAYDADLALKVQGLNSDQIDEVLGYTGRHSLINRSDLVLHGDN